MEREAKVGDHVIWVDSLGRQCNALVTTVWNPKLVNLVFVSLDENKKDQYGRQIEHATSCSYKAEYHAHGYYWMWPGDEPIPYNPPQQS